ncbi:type II toxin-antitoxin system death-on-curing family toxin, partial [Klebsiella pneumoniae]|nr:type II toxin-antitoxin system death-on-curing family toxin [Klebsiella pneumoniae]
MEESRKNEMTIYITETQAIFIN